MVRYPLQNQQTIQMRWRLPFAILFAALLSVDEGDRSLKYRPFARSGHMVRINYTGTQMAQWDFQNKGTRTSQARLSFVLKVPLRNLRPSVIYSVPCDRIVQRAY